LALSFGSLMDAAVGGGISGPIVSENDPEETDHRESLCGFLMQEINRISSAHNDLATSPTTDPMSREDLWDQIYYNGGSEVGSGVAFAAMMNPSTQFLGTFLSYTYDISNVSESTENPFMAGLAGGFVGISGAALAGEISFSRTGTRILSTTGRAASRAATVVGAGYTGYAVFGKPYFDYRSSNQPVLSGTERRYRLERMDSHLKSLEPFTDAYQLNNCDDFL